MWGKFAYRFVAILCILTFLFRFFWTEFNSLPNALTKSSEEILVQGYVIGLPVYAATHTSVDFKTKEKGLLRLIWYGPRPLIQPGSGWELWVKIKSLNPMVDYDRYLKRRGYQGEGSVEALKPWTRRFEWDHPDLLNTWRFWFRRKILFYANLVQLPQASPLFLALGIGDSSELTPRMWRVLQDTGTSHLVAISGLHIGLIGLLFFWVIRRLWALSFTLTHKLAAQKAAAIGGFLGALGYGLISGLGIPAQRTLIMLAVAALYQCYGRTGGSFKGWTLAFLLCLAWQPWGLFSLSMWLSFLAVFSLIFLLSHRIRPSSGIWAHLKFQFALYWLLLPATLYGFGVISTVAFGVNLWAIPLVSFMVVPILFLGMVLMNLPDAWGILPWSCFYVSGKGALLWWWGLEKFAHLPYAGLYFHPPTLRETISAQIGLFLIFAPKGVPGRWVGMLLVIPMFLHVFNLLSLFGMS